MRRRISFWVAIGAVFVFAALVFIILATVTDEGDAEPNLESVAIGSIGWWDCGPIEARSLKKGETVEGIVCRQVIPSIWNPVILD